MLHEVTTSCRSNNGKLQDKLHFIDLFCGCGGFTLGMERAGFHCLAAIDSDAEAVSTLHANLPNIDHVLQRDLTAFSPHELSDLIGTRDIDVIVGGPPCQGFSTARQVDGANHGERLKNDPRRYLYREFLRYVDFFQPRVFVMENVLGLRSAAGGDYFTAVQKEARQMGRAHGHPGYRVHGQVEDAWKLGVPQKRRRQLIVGVRGDLQSYFLPELHPAPRAIPHTTLGPAICDLPILQAGGGEDERDYNDARRAKHLRAYKEVAYNYLFRVLEVDRAKQLTNHTARPHNNRDLRDFRRLKEGQNSCEAMRKGVVFEFPYNKSSFKDRYTRQSRMAPCSTIVAHLSKDGLMFIHPTQNRSLTPREAARVQTFPDWFRFPAGRTHAFRLIGNAVPPLVAEAVGLAVKQFLRVHAPVPTAFEERRVIRDFHNGQQPIDLVISGTSVFRSRTDAAREVKRITTLDARALRALPKDEFLRSWYAVLFLLPDLHPDNAIDHGLTEEEWPECKLILPGLPPKQRRRYARSGWPVALTLVGREAWRRREAGQLTDREIYCTKAPAALMGSGSEALLP